MGTKGTHKYLTRVPCPVQMSAAAQSYKIQKENFIKKGNRN